MVAAKEHSKCQCTNSTLYIEDFLVFRRLTDLIRQRFTSEAESVPVHPSDPGIENRWYRDQPMATLQGIEIRSLRFPTCTSPPARPAAGAPRVPSSAKGKNPPLGWLLWPHVSSKVLAVKLAPQRPRRVRSFLRTAHGRLANVAATACVERHAVPRRLSMAAARICGGGGSDIDATLLPVPLLRAKKKPAQHSTFKAMQTPHRTRPSH